MTSMVAVIEKKRSGAEVVSESEPATGAASLPDTERRASDGEADNGLESDRSHGLPTRYIDDHTEVLGQLAAQWQDFQQMRKSAAMRGLDESDVAVLLAAETHFAKKLKKYLRVHPMWPWLAQHPGTGGVHVARLLARIGDPRRFPGQQCDKGHTWAPSAGLRSRLDVASCPFVDIETGEVCPGRVQPPRTTTGTRALYRYFGLDGPRATSASGHRYDRLGKTALLQPDGIADQIIKHRIQPWRDVYDRTKERIASERGAEVPPETDRQRGAALPSLRPYEVHERARKVAAKEFLGDLLQEWKGRAEPARVSEAIAGPAFPQNRS